MIKFFIIWVVLCLLYVVLSANIGVTNGVAHIVAGVILFYLARNLAIMIDK